MFAYCTMSFLETLDRFAMHVQDRLKGSCSFMQNVISYVENIYV